MCQIGSKQETIVVHQRKSSTESLSWNKLYSYSTWDDHDSPNPRTWSLNWKRKSHIGYHTRPVFGPHSLLYSSVCVKGKQRQVSCLLFLVKCPHIRVMHPSMLSVGWALSLNSPLQWQAVSPSEKTPDLKRALRTLLSKMKVMSTAATTAPNTQLRAPCHWICTHTQNTVYRFSIFLSRHISMRCISDTNVQSHVTGSLAVPQTLAAPFQPRHVSSVWWFVTSSTGASATPSVCPSPGLHHFSVADLNGATLLLGHFAYFFPPLPTQPVTEHVCFHTAPWQPAHVSNN